MMRFSELTDYFEQMEQTSSRLALIDLLAGLFKQTEKDEIARVIYLTQGRVAPFYAPIEMGMADKTVAQAIAQSYFKSKEEVLNIYGKLGDMGLVVAELSQNDTNFVSEVTVEQVFNTLTEIAHIKGEGTVNKRITLLASLLSLCDSRSAKHLVRIPLGNNRLGIGDPTILDGLALAYLKDRGKRKMLESAYNKTSDLGLIGKTLAYGGLEAVEKLDLSIGCPIRSELCERLPNPEKVFEKMSFTSEDGSIRGVNATPKYDGFRVQIHKNGNSVQMFSRNLEDMTPMFPELIAGVLKQVKAESVILDSEALAYLPESEEFLPFQETTKRRRKHNITETAKTLPLKAFVFDILYLNGKSLIEVPHVERMEALKKVIEGEETLIAATGEMITKPEALQILLDDSISKGLEGIVVKRPDSFYVAGGRNFNWVKLKRHSSGELQDTLDCVILGYIFGRGKRAAFGAGALLVGVYNPEADEFVTVSKIGTGLTDVEWQSIKIKTHGLELASKPARVSSLIKPSVWVKPEIVIEVMADEITRSPLHTAGYALRFPRLITFRDQDKKPEDATTVKELVGMYMDQGRKGD